MCVRRRRHVSAWILADSGIAIVVIGAIVADGRSPRRIALAVGTAVLFTLTIPWWGQTLVDKHTVPLLVGRVVQDAFGIAAVVLLIILARLRDVGRRASAG